MAYSVKRHGLEIQQLTNIVVMFIYIVMSLLLTLNPMGLMGLVAAQVCIIHLDIIFSLETRVG